MATWKKIITSGSIAELNHLSASGDIVPVSDNVSSLGSSGQEFKDLYIDGTANIDSLVADTADINAGTVDAITSLTAAGNFLINGSGSFTQMNIGATTNTFDAFFNLNPSTTDKDLFLIQSGSFQSVKVNSSGVLNLGGFETEPTAVTGGFYYNSDENEFYLGV